MHSATHEFTNQEARRSGWGFTQYCQVKEERFTGDLRWGGGGRGGGGVADLGGNVELVDKANLLYEILAGVGGHVEAHLLQERN